MTVRTLHDPSHREALWALEAAFDRGELITVFGECRVDYEGRASSTLGAGKRLLVLKPDGSALVHTDEKRTPVNWQPPGSDHYAAVREGRLERTPVEFQGELGAAPLSSRVDVDPGDHERADTLRSLDLGSRSVLRFSLEGQITYGAGRPVER